MTPDEYQKRVGTWHLLAWPNADAVLIALKLAEETGEVAAVIGKQEGHDRLVVECADVLNVLSALAYRQGITLGALMRQGLESVGA